MTYNYHIDPGHGWVEVPMSEIRKLKLTKTITHYSYKKGGTCYLEEDCDMASWMKAYQNYYGEMPNLADVHHDQHNSPECFIRSLPLYSV